MWVPVSSYLIQHPKGNLLVDTGWSEEIRAHARRHLGWLSHAMFKGTLPPGHSVKERLSAVGLQDQDLDYVLLTHLHSDHVSGLKGIRGAKQVLTSSPEWKAANKDFGHTPSLWQGVPIQTYELENIPYGPYNQGIDLFGDKTLFLVHTPGHSKGQFSVMVKTEQGWVLLVSDVGYAERSWSELILPGIITNPKEASDSLRWVQEFSIREDCRLVLANHDPNISPQIVT
ncbi:N-acyl homoserine lactonase AttM [compost metagenome]